MFLLNWLLDRLERGSLENTASLADDFVCLRDTDLEKYFMNVGVQRETDPDFKLNHLMTDIPVHEATSYEY